MTGVRHRYFFVHVMRTAGTALRRRLANHFGATAVYPAKGVDGPDILNLVLSTDRLHQQLSARGDQIAVITGHFPLRTIEQLEGTFTTLTLLREPVSRTLSFLRHQQEDRVLRFLERRSHGASRHAERSIVEIYEDMRALAQTQNTMTRMLSLTPAEMVGSMMTPIQVNGDHLTRAKEALAEMDAVGLQEEFEPFCAELATRFDWSLGEPEIVNTTAAAEVPQGLRDRIAEDNALDIELYEFAKRFVEPTGRRLESAAPR